MLNTILGGQTFAKLEVLVSRRRRVALLFGYFGLAFGESRATSPCRLTKVTRIPRYERT